MPKGTEVKKYKNNQTRHSGVVLERIEHKIDLLSENYVGMKEKLDATFEKVGEMAEDVTIVKDGLEFVKNSLKRKVDIGDFSALHKKAR